MILFHLMSLQIREIASKVVALQKILGSQKASLRRSFVETRRNLDAANTERKTTPTHDGGRFATRIRVVASHP